MEEKELIIEQYDCDRVADLLWWIKGYIEAHESIGNETSIHKGHISSLQHILKQVEPFAKNVEDKIDCPPF